MTEPLAGAVDALVMPPAGRRVMVMVWNRRAIIMGALRGPDLPEIPKMPDEIISTDWKPLTVSSGWGEVRGHTPSFRRWGDLVIISGAVERRVGGYLSSLVTMPDAALRPVGTQFIGSSVTSRGQASELYMSGSGVVSVQGYTAIGDDPGMIVPLSCVYMPVKK
nr:MAG TPA: receptor binding protein [Caudoviricetes sp.]